jgi:hypothetical protein
MPTRPDMSAAFAAKKASSPELSKFFLNLQARAETLAKLQDEFIETIKRNREARTGKKFNYSKNQQKSLAEFDRDAEKATQELEAITSRMDDSALLTSALSGEEQQLQLDEQMFPHYREEDKPMASKIIEFRKETIRIIRSYIDASPLKEKVLALHRPFRNSKKSQG